MANNKLNKQDASIIYQKALKSDKKFSVQVITGSDFNKINKITKPLFSKDGWKHINPDSYETNPFRRTSDDVTRQTTRLLEDNPGLNKVYLFLPETGMCLDDQRLIIINALQAMTDSLPDAEEINLIVETHSPFVISDCTAGNLTIVKKNSDITVPMLKHGTKDLLTGNLYDIHVTVQDNGSCMGECGRRFVMSYIDSKDNPETVSEEEKNAVKFIGDPFLTNQIKRMLKI